MRRLQRGFSIVSAIFLLVVLAFLGAAMVTFSTSQQQSSALDVMGVRAYQASRAGIEWGAFQILQPAVAGGAFLAACTPGPTTNTLAAGTLAGTLSGFTVAVNCTSVAVPDANATGGTATVYQLTSTATRGVAGTADYVERQITVSIGQ
jgi:MSHA biogenesis protein MshP